MIEFTPQQTLLERLKQSFFAIVVFSVVIAFVYLKIDKFAGKEVLIIMLILGMLIMWSIVFLKKGEKILLDEEGFNCPSYAFQKVKWADVKDVKEVKLYDVSALSIELIDSSKYPPDNTDKSVKAKSGAKDIFISLRAYGEQKDLIISKFISQFQQNTSSKHNND